MKRKAPVPKKSAWINIRKGLVALLASLFLGFFAAACLSGLAGNLSQLPDEPYVIFSLIFSGLFFLINIFFAGELSSENGSGRVGNRRRTGSGDSAGWGGSDGGDCGGGSCGGGSDGGGGGGGCGGGGGGD